MSQENSRPGTVRYLLGDRILRTTVIKPSAHTFLLRRAYAGIRLVLLLAIVVYLAWEMVRHWSDVQSLSLRIDGWNVIAAAVLGILAYQCLFGGWLILLWRVGCFDRTQLKFYSRVCLISSLLAKCWSILMISGRHCLSFGVVFIRRAGSWSRCRRREHSIASGGW